MKKQTIAVRTRTGISNIEGYVERGLGIHKVLLGEGKLGKEWAITDLATGMGCYNKHFSTRKEAVEHIEGAINCLNDIKARRPEAYADCVEAFSKLSGNTEVKANNKTNTEVKTDKGVKKMAKTTKATKATLEAENKALKAELEALKKLIEQREQADKVTIDTFDVEGYLSKRDDTARITPELVEAIANTEGLSATREGKDEWLFVRGDSEEATKSRKDIFKAMSFKWSPNHNAWILAPYPIASKKRWGAKKARKAMATA